MVSELVKMKCLPLVSVVMITYNHDGYIKESLMSVIEQNRQKYNLEILIVDDGSSDDTQKVIQEVQILYPDLVFPTFKEHVGVSAVNRNFNEQIKKSRGEYITFLAGDDYFVGDGILKLLDAFEANKSIDIVIGEGRNFDTENNKYLETCQEDVIVKMLENQDISGVYDYITSNIPSLFIQGFMVKRYLLEAVDYFDEELIADDWVLSIRIFKFLVDNNRLAHYVDNEVFRRNILPNSTSRNNDVHLKRILGVIDKYIPKDKQFTVLKTTYFVYFLKYFHDKKYKKSFLYFVKYFSRDVFLGLLFNRVMNRFIK